MDLESNYYYNVRRTSKDRTILKQFQYSNNKCLMFAILCAVAVFIFLVANVIKHRHIYYYSNCYYDNICYDPANPTIQIELTTLANKFIRGEPILFRKDFSSLNILSLTHLSAEQKILITDFNRVLNLITANNSLNNFKEEDFVNEATYDTFIKTMSATFLPLKEIRLRYMRTTYEFNVLYTDKITSELNEEARYTDEFVLFEMNKLLPENFIQFMFKNVIIYMKKEREKLVIQTKETPESELFKKELNTVTTIIKMLTRKLVLLQQ
jgi:hypothetical protein